MIKNICLLIMLVFISINLFAKSIGETLKPKFSLIHALEITKQDVLQRKDLIDQTLFPASGYIVWSVKLTSRCLGERGTQDFWRISYMNRQASDHTITYCLNTVNGNFTVIGITE